MLPAWLARLTTLASTTLATVCVAAVLMSSCAGTPDIPPWFDGIQRFPIKTASINGQRIAYLDEGQGPPLILIHGYGGSMWQWEYQQLPLAAHFRVITPDLIGSGLSDKPDLDYRPEDLIESVRGLMDRLGLSTATLVGNSMGAGVAIGMALTHPQRVDRLVLIDGLPDHVRERLASPLMQRAVNTRLPVWLARLGNWLFPGTGTDAVLKEIVFDHGLLTPAVLDRSNRNRRHPGIVAPLLSIRDSLPLWEQHFATRLNEIRHSTLILWGEQDRLFPP
ncbi:MAG: alpha/beta hydrolase, partial [Nitrospira defluvii]|nr:alpha/beta hydrolase [Nitrospira defluvii]